jgi:hypothetical protein
MPSVVALVSRAVFEKMVPKDVAVGHVVATDRYVSSQPAFARLGPGDALFLVTVRPPDEALWLVAVLEGVQRKGDAWVGAVNTTPITAITGAFTAKPGRLGMSLQTPRVLAAADVAKLRGGAATPAVAEYRSQVAATPAAARAERQARSAARGAEVLRLVNHRRPFAMLDALPAAQRAQLTRLTRQNRAGKPSALVAHEDWAPMELVDVLDVASNTVTHQLYVWPWGSGELFVHDTTERAGVIIQHGFDQEVDDQPFRAALAAAYARAQPRLAETVDFQLDKPRPPTPAEIEDKDAATAAAAYARLAEALGPSDERYRDYAALTPAQQATIRAVFKSTLVQLITSRHDLRALGLPPECRLRSWCGHSPASELEQRAGRWPVWKWLLEARARRVTDAAAIEAITTARPRPAWPEIARMACEPFYDYGFWGELLLYEGGARVAGPEQARMVELLAQLVDESANDAAVGFADRVKRDKVEPHVWSQALAAIAASALARRAARTGASVGKQLAPLAKQAGALFASAADRAAAPVEAKPAKAVPGKAKLAAPAKATPAKAKPIKAKLAAPAEATPAKVTPAKPTAAKAKRAKPAVVRKARVPRRRAGR